MSDLLLWFYIVVWCPVLHFLLSFPPVLCFREKFLPVAMSASCLFTGKIMLKYRLTMQENDTNLKVIYVAIRYHSLPFTRVIHLQTSRQTSCICNQLLNCCPLNSYHPLQCLNAFACETSMCDSRFYVISELLKNKNWCFHTLPLLLFPVLSHC